MTAAPVSAGVSQRAVDRGAQCICDDPQVDRLRDLIREGHTQQEASRIIWGTPAPGMPRVEHDLLRDEVQQVVSENRHHFPRLFARGC